jgi:hypothetical protein
MSFVPVAEDRLFGGPGGNREVIEARQFGRVMGACHKTRHIMSGSGGKMKSKIRWAEDFTFRKDI